MYKNTKKLTINQKGISAITLTITVIVLLIIAGIGISTGMNILKKVELEELKTNMLLIEAKAREYVEQANFKIGKETDTAKIQEIKDNIYGNTDAGAKLQKGTEANLANAPESIPVSECYVLTDETLNLWGLNEIKLDTDEKYLVKFDETNLSVEVYNTKGYEEKYSLTDLEK